MYEQHKRRDGRIVPVPDKSRILVLKSGLSFEESVKHEVYMIHVLGRKDLGTGMLRNASNGGEGNKGHRHTREIRQQMSIQRKGKKKTIEHRLKISASHVGIGHTDEAKQKMKESHLGMKWWVNPDGVTTQAHTSPGPSYIRGRKYK